MLDGIVEANANPVITYDVDGRTHHLKWWDSGVTFRTLNGWRSSLRTRNESHGTPRSVWCA